MLIVNLEEAQAGMILAAPVAHPENPQHDLLKRGYCIEESILPRLRDMGVNHLYVDYPALNELDRHLAPQLSPVRQQIYRQIREAMGRVEALMSAGVSYSDYHACTHSMLLTILSQGTHPIYMERVSGLGRDAVAHATTVAHLALVIGLRLEAYLVQQRARLSAHHAREVVNLGVAGMLHDIGKMRLPAELRERCEVDAPCAGALDDAKARGEWESHARIGYDLVRSGVESSAAAAVLHHHQHFDGTGFPGAAATRGPGGFGKPAVRDASPPKGRDIHVFARILFVADLYANLVRPPGTNIRRGNLEVLHLMRTRYAASMDPTIFRTLEAVAPPFMPGSKVVLGDRTTAAIVRVIPSHPYAPVVRRFKPGGAELDGPCLDLHDRGAPPLVALAGGQPVAHLMPGPGRDTAPLRAA